MKANLDIIYNEKYLVIVPQMTENYYKDIEYTFKNVIFMKNNIDEIKTISDFINNSNFEQLIFVDYRVEYEKIISNLNKKHSIKYLYTNSLGNFSDQYLYSLFESIYKAYQNEKVSAIGFLDYGLYTIFKNKGDNVYYIKLDSPIDEKTTEDTKSNTIGILNKDTNNTHSFYNELSAIKLTNKYTAHVQKASKITKTFGKLFNINMEDHYSISNVMKNNLVNLCVNFTDNDYTIFLKSMDLGIPCIMGNTDLLDDNKYLKEQLVVNSDDDVNEIKDKILSAIKNKKEILKEYEKFRKNYSKESKKLAEEFVGTSICEEKQTDNDILVSVVVPVYNTSTYLEKSLNSIMDAIQDKTEVLIINDGSKDNSEEIILKFVEKYPNVIRYIKQENHGLGNVRNVGLKEAKGKYIASVDSDDTINSNFFKEAREYLEKNIDIVIYDWKSITEDEQKFNTAAIEWSLHDKSKYEGILFSTIMPSTCNKIIKKSLYEELNLNFIEDRYEDLSINPLILLKAKTIKYINKPYYEYYLRSGSIMRSAQGYSMIDIIGTLNKRFDDNKDICNIDLDEMKYYTFSWRIEEYIMNQLYTIDDKELSKYIKYIYDKDYEIICKIFESRFYKKMLENTKKETLGYIIKRNKAFKEKKLEKYIKDVRKSNNYKKITPPIVYYGENE